MNLITETVRSHPRPGSNSNGNIVTSVTLASDPISADDLAMPQTRRNGDPGVVSYAQGVRRLTPIECERLQGFPDQWTAHGPDSRRYSALGDAVTVPVAEWIGRRLAQASQGGHYVGTSGFGDAA